MWKGLPARSVIRGQRVEVFPRFQLAVGINAIARGKLLP